ncbi:dynein axonemal heavy chain 1-like [Prorops nasuta]|uniref:dynein axonemal heavy chain 1-like n=1 Tax=Prorops nasuta TaxID=863751 RepID=UPI0034CFAA5F
MERLKWIYKNLRIEDVLAKEGISTQDLLPPDVLLSFCSQEEKYGLKSKAHFLPLELFDDEEFDCRTENDWLNLAEIDGGARHPLPASVFVEKSPEARQKLESNLDKLDHLYYWCSADVTAYDKHQNLWTVFTLDKSKKTYFLPRIYIRFLEEDPRIFAKRLAAAIEKRRATEANLRYHFYLDCAKLDDVPSYTIEVEDAIEALCCGRGSSKLNPSHVRELIEEASLDYRRTMCDLMWRKLIKQRPGIFHFVEPTPQEVSTLETRMEKVIPRMPDFQDIKTHLHWLTLYVLPEVHEAMMKIVDECIKVSGLNLFTTNYGKSSTLKEFDSLQNQSTMSTVKYLKQSWLDKIAQSTRLHLRDLGKGWFDLEQKNSEIYDVMKLKRFMNLVLFRMQHALRCLVENSIALYTSMLEEPSLCTMNVAKEFMWGENLVDSQFLAATGPVFNIDLAMTDQGAYYATDLEAFLDSIIFLYDNALTMCHQIKQVHPSLLTHLKFPADLCLSSVGLMEEHVCRARDRLRNAYEKAIIPLKAYAFEYMRHLNLFTLDIDGHVNQFQDEEEYSAADIKKEISFQLRMKASLEVTLPESICIGAFCVNVQPLKEFLVKKRDDCAKKLLIIFTERCRATLDEIMAEYGGIIGRLKEEPRSIEHLFEQREWMETIPLTVKQTDSRMQKLKIEYEILDHFWWNLSDEDFKDKWTAIGHPRQIQLLITETNENMEEYQEKFHKFQLQDEVALLEKIETLIGNTSSMALQRDMSKVHEIAIDARRIWKTMLECQEQGLLLNERQKLFGMPVVPFENLTKLKKELEPYKNLWITAADWLKWYEIWTENPLVSIDARQIDEMITEMHKTMSRCARIFEEAPEVASIAIATRDQIEAFKPYAAIIQALRNPGIKPRHFEELSAITGIQMALTPSLTFKNLILLGIMDFDEVVNRTADGAAKEYSIEETLDKMMSEWDSVNMEVHSYKETGTYIMKISDEIMIMLDDHVLHTQQINLSPFKAVFEDRITDWERKLNLTQEVISLWVEAQKQWMYLEPIFSAEDVSRQLPVETRKFGTMERNWRRIMKDAVENPKVITTCSDRTLLDSLRECLNLLAVVQKGLSDFLETKRLIFPRFFFLSDDELLEIIAQSKKVQAVQPYLKKCFENMKELKFEEDLRITKMYSAEYEEVVLEPSVYPEGNVENWLLLVESAMRTTLREHLAKSLRVVETTPRKDWVYMWPGQVVLAAGQTYWTAHVEDAIANDTLHKYHRLMLSHMDTLRELMRGRQTEVQRLMLEAVITIEVHARDVLQKLIDEKVRSVKDFDWISQLRYYWISTPDQDLKIRAVNAEFPYGYEYLGNNGRLVITPLTDRCYLTLTGALHLKFGGAPSGPAGTGKTETTKDLAKAFAIQCVVFNCSDQLDYLSMGKFFKGLASAGAWACFDEFNRIDIEVLSVVAQQIMVIQRAQQMRATVLLFEGTELSLKASCAVFITMNPGYAGRTELPDNLKALFRPVAMMVPDYALIAEISLFSYGFTEARKLAGKITTTFKLSSEQLSSQDHYDFGMRAVKSVIAAAGNLKRSQQDLEEEQICMRALRDVNVPKFLKDDLILFNGIVSDLFPNLIERPPNYGILEHAIRKTIGEKSLEELDDFVKKIIQLYETTVVRHGLMLIGPTGSGKTKCYEVLRDACTSLKGQRQPNDKPFVRIHTHILNPKSITMGQLYGEYDLDTHEWTDGILPALIRKGTTALDDHNRWYIFDGPVDAVWIENLNTVLDDNKKLCLTSGEIMKLLPSQTMMFEVADLESASPATVSRCGMVYLDPKILSADAVIRSWTKTLPQGIIEHSAEITKLSEQMVFPGLKILREKMREIIPSVDLGILKAYINLMDYRFGPMAGRDGKPPPTNLLEPWAAFATVWSLGASCDYQSRVIFNDWLRNVEKKEKHWMRFPEEGLIFDYRLHDGGFMDEIDGTEPIPPKWLKWENDIPRLKITPETKFADIEVPTVDSVRNGTLIEYLVSSGVNVLCVGPSGSGKTLTITAKLSRSMPKKYICDFITFSAQTSANQIQDTIDGKLDKRRKGAFGPPFLKQQIFFIDDFNMPARETYGAQPPIELLRQFMDFQGWYDRKEIGSFRLIEDVNFIGAMAPPGGGRNPVTARLLRHMHFLAFLEMEDSVKINIFGTILNSWLSRTSSLGDLLEAVVHATLNVFATIRQALLPTPDKSHYTFNLRDLSKVFQGILMADPTKMASREKLFLLWYHENTRVYSDRLVDEADRHWFDQLLRIISKEKLDLDLNKVIRSEILFYGDLMGGTGQYDEMDDVEKLSGVLKEFLEEYNSSTTSPMNLVLFHDAIDHICRILRILRQPRGNALLLGMGGSGRRSLTRLSSYIRDYQCFEIQLSKAYSMHDWREDIKSLTLKAGVHNQLIVFLFSDTQIKFDSMLEDINNILNNGDVPNLYKHDEMDKIYFAMKGPLQEAGMQINKSNLYSAFLKIVRNNLHTIFTMSPIGEIFRARIRQFPALVNCCTIDWFSPWPETALQSVGLQFLSGIKDDSITEDVMKAIVKTCQYMHSSTKDASKIFLEELGRHNYVTPTSYLELLSRYGDLLSIKKNELIAAIARLSTGLAKLASTAEDVKNMQQVLKDMKPHLELATENTAKVIEQIRRGTIEAEKTRSEAVKQEEAALILKRENKLIRDEAEFDLSEAKPLLDAAEMSLKALNKGDITEVKAMKRPPVGVLLVIEAMCIVNDIKPNKLPGNMPGEKILDYWTPGSQMLADAGHFLHMMESYNKDNLTAEMIQKLQPYIENPSFEPSQVLQVSKACHSLCLWVHAMYNYYFVNKKVAPKMAALAKAEEILTKTEETLSAAIARLTEVQEKIEELEAQLRVAEMKRNELEAEKQLCEDRMMRAVKLIHGLAEEQELWMESVVRMKKSLRNIVGDILLCSGAIAYLAPFTDHYRVMLFTGWYKVLEQGVPHTPGSTTVSILGDQMEIRKWHMDGLPRDTLSVENAVLAINSKRWPLFIDPQGQANSWIRKMCKVGGLQIVKMTDSDLLRSIETCVRLGTACLIENIGTKVEPALDPVLSKSTFRHSGQLSVKIGDNIVPYNTSFRLFLTTRLTNPHYTPEVTVKVLLVNFALTASGLQDQMLSIVAIQERPDLEETRNTLIVANAEMKRDLKEIESKILQKLSQSEGSAVDDVDLIATLDASKAKSSEIKSKVEIAEVTHIEIDATRSLYIPVAKRAQILFFCVSDLQNIDPMYQYSLIWFVNIFKKSISDTQKVEEIGKRIDTINDAFTFSLFSNVCRSLFEKHKLHFAFLMSTRIGLVSKRINQNEWSHFLSGPIPAKELSNPAPQWISTRSWKDIQALERLPKFQNFIAAFKGSLPEFKKIFDTQEAHLVPFPEPWQSSLDDFQKLMVFKCLRPDKVTNAMQMYIAKYLGQQFVEPQTAELSVIYAESSSTTPLVFVLSSGTDPADDLYKFAERLRVHTKLFTISLGQGQGPRAEAMIRQSMEVGNWVFFQNCHLAPSWMPKLDELVDQLTPENSHQEFRLWLTSAPSPDFPVGILQNSCKLTIEPPRGIKANMQRAYLIQVTDLQAQFQAESPKTGPFKWLVFSLCLFHAALLERRKFGPLGFNIPYEFTDGDLTICLSQLYMFLMEYETLPFKVLIYTAGQINYGGRITDDWDRRCLLTILEDYYNHNVVAEGYRFDKQGYYCQLNPTTSLADYAKYIKTLPLNDDPGMFGMHPNADISYKQSETYSCLETLLAIQPKETGEAKESVEDVIGRLATEMLQELPNNLDLADIQKKYPVMYEESFNTVLLQEAKRYNVLLNEIKSSLNDILKAIKGLIVMSDKLESTVDKLFSNKIPQIWQDKGYASLKPLGAWYIDLKARINFIRTWQEKGIPAAFWISGFYFPQAFLTGTLQNFVRKHAISIDTIDFSYKVLKESPAQRPLDGCVIYGLFLEGCRWDGSYLAESKPKELYTDMKPILLLPEAHHKISKKGIYICPIYKTIKRAGALSTTGHSTNFVLATEIPSREPQSHWIKRGVAMICALDY